MTSATLRMLVSMAVAAHAGAVSAQQSAAGNAPPVDTSQWECKLCPYPQGGRGEVGAGAVNVSSDSYQFGRYTGLRKETYPSLDASARYVEGAGYLDFRATDLGLPYGSVAYEHGMQGEAKLYIRYAELPFRISDSARTPFSGVGTGSLSLPAGWVRGVNTQTMPGLAASLQEVKIDSSRRQLGFGFAINAVRDWELGVNVRQERREGTRRMAGSFFFNTTQLIAPVDTTTDQIEAYASYAASRWQIRFAYQGSTFADHNTSVRWDNPFAEVLPGATLGQIGQPPGNQFHQLSASGAYQITDTTRASASLALGRMEQDENFLPATVNPTIAPIALPRSSLQGRVDTTRAELKLVSALSARWGLNLAYSYDDRDNRTPQSAFTWVTTDLLAVATPRTNLPYGYTRNLFKVSADYRITPRDKASVGIDRDAQERSFQEVSKTTEDTAWAKYALRRNRFDVSLNYAHARRDGTSYTAVPQISPPENPVLRKYNMADRERDLMGVRVATTPVESITVGLDYSLARDDYAKSPVGMTYGRQHSLGADLSAQVGEGTRVHLYYSREEITSRQAGAQSFTNPPDWSAENVDTIQTAGIGVKHALIPDKVDIGADLTRSRSVGDIRVSVTASDPSFPGIESDIDSLKLYATYKVRDDLTVRASLWRERYSSRNWAIDGVGASTIPNVLALGETSPDYRVSVASLSLRYRF
ncbi:MAG: MtrB/PioB family decaheme-associated outer membrane protein [Burkholderiales bacterium]